MGYKLKLWQKRAYGCMWSCVCLCVCEIYFIFIFILFFPFACAIAQTGRPAVVVPFARASARSIAAQPQLHLIAENTAVFALKKKNAYNNHWYFPVTCCFILSTQISGTCGCYLDIFGMLTSIEPDFFFFFLAGTDNGHTLWLVNVSPSLDITPP